MMLLINHCVVICPGSYVRFGHRWPNSYTSRKEWEISEYINKDYQYNETIDFYSVKFNIQNFKAIGLIVRGRGTVLKFFKISGDNKI